MTAILMLSCNKNRFDFDQLETVEGSGQWKLPIGSAHITLREVMTQLGENELISYDDDGNMQIKLGFELDRLIKGSSFLTLGTIDFNSTLTFANPVTADTLPEPYEAEFRFHQVVNIDPDSATVESAVVKTGTMIFQILGNIADYLTSMEISSSDIYMPNGDTLYTTESSIDMTGATFRVHDELGDADSTLVINYVLHYLVTGIDDPEYEVTTIIGLSNFQFQELSGAIDAFSYEFEADTAFSLPLDNVNGALSLVGAKINIKEKNSFVNLHANLCINYAELYGGGLEPSPVFNNYPYVIEIVPSTTYVPVMENETVNLNYNTEYDGIRFKGSVDFNPTGSDRLITVYDTSALSLGIDAYVPMQFNIPNVTYIDTLDLNMGEINMPSLVDKIILNVLFKSEIPFNLKAQLYTYNSTYQQVTGTLLDKELEIKGSFDGSTVLTDADITLTNELLQRLLQADKLIMNFSVDTDDHDIILNLDNGFGVTIKADVFYGGSISINN